LSYNRPMDVDGHVHVWSDDAGRYPWRPIHGAEPPTIAGSAESVLGVLAANGVDVAVAVQPRAYGDDHAYLLDARRHHPERIVAVAALDPRDPTAPSALEVLVADGVRGLRLDPIGWGTRPLVDGTARPLWDRAARLGLAIELMILPDQLPALRPYAERTPGTTVVIEHAARYGAAPDESLDSLLDLADLPNVFVKVSALSSISSEPPPHRDLWPLLERLFVEFGATRLMWGSDMPWIGADAYGPAMDTIRALPFLDNAGRGWLLGGTASRAFGID